MVRFFTQENHDGAIFATLIADIFCPAVVANGSHHIIFAGLAGERGQRGKDGGSIATVGGGEPLIATLVCFAETFGGGSNESLFCNHTHIENPSCYCNG